MGHFGRTGACLTFSCLHSLWDMLVDLLRVLLPVVYTF